MAIKKSISIVTPCYNEEANLLDLCNRIRATMAELPYDYEQIIIDNASTDSTVLVGRKIAHSDPRVKIIVNARNYGPVKSPYYGVLVAKGAAVILMAADLQEPPEIIPELIEKWENGFDIVLATKPRSEEGFFMRKVRSFYYKFINTISDVPLESNATGFGLFDKKVIESLNKIADPYPYFRGLICDLGYRRCTVDFIQPVRRHGRSKATIYGMIDQAFLAMTKHSKLPLRLMTFLGIFLGLASVLMAVLFFFMKLLYWDSFSMGIAPLLIGGFFLAGVHFLFLGILGEYIGMILTHVRHMPLVIEQERINFSD